MNGTERKPRRRQPCSISPRGSRRRRTAPVAPATPVSPLADGSVSENLRGRSARERREHRGNQRGGHAVDDLRSEERPGDDAGSQAPGHPPDHRATAGVRAHARKRREPDRGERRGNRDVHDECRMQRPGFVRINASCIAACPRKAPLDGEQVLGVGLRNGLFSPRAVPSSKLSASNRHRSARIGLMGASLPSRRGRGVAPLIGAPGTFRDGPESTRFWAACNVPRGQP